MMTFQGHLCPWHWHCCEGLCHGRLALQVLQDADRPVTDPQDERQEALQGPQVDEQVEESKGARDALVFL